MPQSDKQPTTDANRLALEVLTMARDTLIVDLRFLDTALCRIVPEEALVEQITTDGNLLYYDALQVLRAFLREKNSTRRDYLHLTLHCIYRHMFINSLVDHDCWDLACDVAVENTINELELRDVDCLRVIGQRLILQRLKQEVGQLTAERLYRYYLDQHLTQEQLNGLRRLFFADDHSLWYHPPETRPERPGEGEETQETDPDAPSPQQLRNATAQEWKELSERIEIELETTDKEIGDRAGTMSQNLRAVNREKYDYAQFLQRFAELGEIIKINDDEFDYIFYTYGLQLYENLPLIEPLEYKEVKRIREFVIAIDTSGSVRGETVQAFVQKTYNILKQSENFFSKINLHIIQCDADIRQDVKITTQEEFDQYLADMTILGLGGTDFRPVFQYVNRLLEEKELINLKGLLYFTDGLGAFPERRPPYDAAFVFLEESFDYEPQVPPWAMKLMLSKYDL